MKIRFFKFLLLICSFILMLISCASSETQETTVQGETVDPGKAEEESLMAAFRTPQYASEEEWIGLETRAYPELNKQASSYILNHPEGNPDPAGDVDSVCDLSKISVKTDKPQYSIGRGEKITVTVTVTYAAGEKPSDETGTASVYYHVNLERKSGASWERMLYYIADFDVGRARGPFFLQAGESADIQFDLGTVITVLTPGQYRIIAYVDSCPVYAEFELVE